MAADLNASSQEKASVHIDNQPSKPALRDKDQDLFDGENAAVNFRGVSWKAAAILITKFQIGLGALSLPGTFHTLGFFPGILCFIILSCTSTVAGYVAGNARQYYPQIGSICDATEVLFGKTGREIIGVFYYIFLTMVSGAGILATSLAFGALSDDAICTLKFAAIACVASMLLGAGFRSLDKVAWISWLGVICIFVAIWTTAIACASQSRPALALDALDIDLNIRILPEVTFSQAMTAVSNQLFAVGSSGMFFSISAEMKHPEQFTRALLWGQGFICLTCLLISIIVYANIGQYLATPALASAGNLIAKVSYGIALPGLLVTAVLFSHIAAKYWFVKILRGTRHLQSNTVKHWTVWIVSMLVTIFLGFLTVGLVPFFGEFVGLLGSLCVPVFTNVLPGLMMLFYLVERPSKSTEEADDHEEKPSTGNHWLYDACFAYRGGWKNVAIWSVANFLIVTGLFIIVGGTYASTLSILDMYAKDSVGRPFSCWEQ